MRTKFVATLVLLSVALFLTAIAFFGYRQWKTYEENDREKLAKGRDWAIRQVQKSRYGSQLARDEAASDFLNEETTTDQCDWDASPMWGAGYKNPNWISDIKGATGFHVTCETSARDKDNTDLEIDWDYSSDWGVVGIHWGYSYRDVDVSGE